jgi:hypothetical protein
VLVLAGLVVWAWRERRWIFAVVTAVVLLWGCVTYGNDKWVERFNVTVDIAFYAGQDPDMFRWFLDEGMPPSSAFFLRDYEDRYHALFGDAEFQDWVARDGENAYTVYLATHPRFLLDGPLTALFTNQAYGGESLVDHSNYQVADTLGVPAVWPQRATLFTASLLVATGVLSLAVVRRHRVDRRWVLPVALIASTLPHALLAYHAVPSEVARHGAVLAFVLVLGCWWLVILSVDALMRHGSKRTEHRVEASPELDLVVANAR